MNQLKKLREKMEEKGAKNLVISRDENLFYLLQKHVSGYLIISQKDETFFTSKFFTHSKINIHKRISAWPEIKKSLKHLNGKIYSDQTLPKLKTTQTALVEDLRSIKQKFELERIEKASKITTKTLKKIKPLLNDKPTPWEIISLIDSEIRKNKCYNAFDTLVTLKTLEPHAQPMSRKIRAKDLIIIDFGARFQGYCTDFTRTFCLNPTKKQEELFGILKQVQEEAILSVKEKEPLEKLQNQAIQNLKQSLKKFNLKSEEVFLHSLGHGVGIQIHELPYFTKPFRFQKNHLFTIEPGIYHPSFGGIRIEDTIHLNKKPRILTKFKKSLF